jgi:malate dehydrogenase (oxaloacetate-decarboxylating)
MAYLRPRDEWQKWNVTNDSNIRLLEVISNVKPTVLIGCSAQTDAFNESIVKAMACDIEHPIILPLSNPPTRSEAKPNDLVRWTDGKALIATGSPFPPIDLNGKMINIAQCNNARAFPGIGLGVLVAKPTLLSKGILLAAAHALAECSPAQTDLTAPLLPSINDSEISAKHIAAAVAKQAVKEGLSDVDLSNIEQVIDEIYWKPKYLPYRREE